MAVEAHHLHLFPSQLLTSREIISGAENQQSIHSMQMGFASPASGAAAAAGGVGVGVGGSFLPAYTSPVPVTAAAASSSGLTFNDAAAPPRKRPRPMSFLWDDMAISSHLQQQMLDMDCLLVQHAEKVRAELVDRRSRLTRQFLASLEECVSKRLKAKDEEIARIGKLNWALEERIRSLCVENQIWRDLAQSNEATATALRSNLEQVLASQAMMDQQAAAATAEDAESCCSGDENSEEAAKARAPREWQRACRSCHEREPSVLLLPCRHLCLCAACGPAVEACPVCNSGATGSFNVNMS